MSNTQWLFIALAIVFVAIAGYSLWIESRRRTLERRVRELRDKGH